jgi:hypothetical protein
LLQKRFKLNSQTIAELLETVNAVVAMALLSLSLYLAYQIYKRRFYSLTKSGWFASVSFLSFAVVVLSQSLMLLSADYTEAELLARFAVTSALISGFFAVKSFANRGDKEVSDNKISLHKLSYGMYSVVVIGLTWLTTPFKMELTSGVFGGMSYFPIPNLWYLLTLYFGVALFAVHVLRPTSSLLFPATNKPKINEILPGALCASVAFSAFFFNAVLPTTSINILSLGHLIQVCILGGIVYLWRKPSLLETFFISLDKRKTKEAKVTQPASKTMLRVEPGSDYTCWINDFLGNSDPSTNLLLTHEGSKILRSREFNEKCKIVCMSLSEELQVRKIDDVLVVRLAEDLIGDMLRWAFQNMKNGKLVFDNLSHFTLLVGLESAYTLVTMISELSNRYGVDVLFIVSNNTLDEKVLHALEDLVDDILSVKADNVIYSMKKN